MPTDKLDLVSKLTKEERILQNHSLNCISPDDAKYGNTSTKLKKYLSAAAEWKTCAYVQKILLETRVEFSQAEQINLDEVNRALGMFNPLNAALIEGADPKDGGTKHDQLAVIEEIGRFVSSETKALLHPGTTSYDILDTARSYLFRGSWGEVIRPEITNALEKLCNLSERSIDILQVGRTHLQDTSPVLFGSMIAGYAARIAERLEKCDASFEDLRGKVSGIVGTGASIDMVIGENKSLEFEEAVLEKLRLKPDYTATQIVQKERVADVGHNLTVMMHILGDFANDMRLLYSSGIGEVTSRDNAERLGGSSADATKNNPINYENIAGTVSIVESGMRVLYEMIQTDLQRDLRGSKQARYQPHAMMAETYESFVRFNRVLKQLSLNEDTIAKNLEPVRRNPSEAMVAILRGERLVHPEYGVGHDFVKEMGIVARREGRPLLRIALEDSDFARLYDKLPYSKKQILEGRLENYVGSSKEKAKLNLKYVRGVIGD
ncbi:MAG: lyase family protein [Patescibacteria group bacterium]|nr:lyase family protein [Patescibacteria group bacterium]